MNTVLSYCQTAKSSKILSLGMVVKVRLSLKLFKQKEFNVTSTFLFPRLVYYRSLWTFHRLFTIGTLKEVYGWFSLEEIRVMLLWTS